MTRFARPGQPSRRPWAARSFPLRLLTIGTLAAAVLGVPTALSLPGTTGWAATTGRAATTGHASAPQTASAASALRPVAAPGLLAAGSAAAGPFYVPPDPLPPGRPGDVIRYRPAPAPLPGAHAWNVLYLSTTVSGSPAAVSGTVIVPGTPVSGPRPVVAYASGTQGWGDQCAPSREMATGTYDEQFAVDNLLAKGWAVSVTDYPGLGTPGDETYAVGIAEGYAVLDALRAAVRLPAAGLSASAPMAIEGYSQGGGAADWAAQLQPSYAPGLHLTGVAAGGTPANLQAVAANINGSPFFAFLGGAAIGFSAAYPAANLLADLTPAGRAALARLDTMCQLPALALYAGQRIENYTAGHVNPITEPKWRRVLTANDLGAIRPGVPLLQYHGLADEVIPYQVEVALHQQYCALGVTTELAAYPGDHVLTPVEAQPQVISWISGRLAGRPAPSNC